MSDLPQQPFRAFRLREGGDGGEVTTITLDDLNPGEVVIKSQYSSVNYKDALAGTGKGQIARKLPLIGGVDVAGTVAHSEVDGIKAGDTVLVNGSGLSEDRDGGYAEYVRVPGELVIPMPSGLTPYEAMAIGTAGFSAALALVRMEQNGLRPDLGPVAVTGATGGVGSFAIDLLARAGYEAVAVTGKADQVDYLKSLGAARVISREELETKGRPMEKAVWGGAIDNVGDGMLAELLRTTVPWGSIASIGLAGGPKLETTVMPFILRGVSLLGVTSANCPQDRRREVWNRLGSDWKPHNIESIVSATVGLDELGDVFERTLAGKIRGRTVVRTSES